MKSRRLVQRLLIGTGILGVIGIVVLFISYRQVTKNPERALDLIQKQADMHLDKIRQTATKNGIREWYLEARSATLHEHQKQVQLDHPDVEFFMENNDNVHLTADQGTIYTDSNRITIFGQVSATTELYQFHTHFLDYDPKDRKLVTDTPVTLTGTGMTLRANRMSMDLDTRVFFFEGDVEGIINDKLQL